MTESHKLPLASLITRSASHRSIPCLFNRAAKVNPPINKKIIVLENGAIAATGERILKKYARTGTSKAVTGSGIISDIHNPAHTIKINKPSCIEPVSTIDELNI